MGKKSKKKTVASTKKNETMIEQEKPKNGKFKKLLKKIKPKKKELDQKAEETTTMSELVSQLEATATPEKKAKLTPENSRKIKGAVLLVISICGLVFVSVLIFQKIFRAQPLAELLPADATVGLLEVNIDGDSSQVQQFYKALANYPLYRKAELIGLLNVVLPATYQNISPWIGRKAGFVMVKSSTPDGKLNPVLMVEVKDANAAIGFFKTRLMQQSGDELLQENLRGYTLYHYKNSQTISFTFFNKYLVLTSGYDLLKDFINEKSNSNLNLADEVNYRKVANNLPSNGLAFGYVNIPKFFEVLLKNPVFMSRKIQDFNNLQPFLKIFSAAGMTVFAENKEFHIQTFSSINRAELNGNTYLTYSDKYAGKLLELAAENPIMIMGGHDINKELSRMEDLFKAGTKANAVIVQGLLEYQKEKYLGKDISLTDDIFPLLKGEYLVTAQKSFEQPEVNFYLELNDKNSDLLRVEKIVNAFVKMSAIFEPKIQDVTLPDGTKGQEIVASPEQITRSDSVYNGVNISSLAIGDKGFGIHYTALGNVLAVSTSLESLQQSIDRSLGSKKTNLKNSALYKDTIQPIARTADQINELNLGAIFAAFGLNNNKVLSTYLAPFGTISSAKNFFDDGIADLYLIKVL
ncbi:MAG: hypothetical protein WC843_00890 [Candidatus Gracilibacteria bacterium]|jgi:hypothetical protein